MDWINLYEEEVRRESWEMYRKKRSRKLASKRICVTIVSQVSIIVEVDRGSDTRKYDAKIRERGTMDEGNIER